MCPGVSAEDATRWRLAAPVLVIWRGALVALWNSDDDASGLGQHCLLSADDLAEIEAGSAAIKVEGNRYPEDGMKMVGL